MSEAVEAEEIPTGFRRTQLGPKTITVPEHWNRTRIKDVSEVVTRGKQPTYVDEPGVPVLNQSCIYWDGYHQENLKYLDEDIAKNWKPKHFAAKGDILINSTGRGTLGRALYWDKESGTHAIDSHITRVSVDSDTIDSEFLRYYLGSTWGQTMLYVFCVAGSTGQIELSKTDLMSMPLLCPPVEEQRYIADILSTVDKQIQQTDEIIEETHELKQGLVQDLVFFGKSHNGTQTVQLGPMTTEIAESWDVATVGEVTTKAQYGSSESLSTEGEYPVFRMNNIEDGRMISSPMKYSNLEEEKAKKYRVEKGDILFNRTNSIDLVGKSGIFDLEGEYIFASYLIRLRTNEKMNPYFLNYYLNSHIGQGILFSIATRGASQANINATNLKTVNVPLPPREQQDKIVEQIQKVEGKIEQEQKTKQRLQELKRGLMQDLLTGKVHVKTDN